ncbi:hypothetical protein HPP92_027887 [Vanilla planifolia]|uniref:Uncharacterized protein n=1 Tax=Vanilla planifolia TaxID=51239 RepID=A0A835P7D6_VANPL|nr:hypothetical protein HPP92_027887 [Vanilla planifolia]
MPGQGISSSVPPQGREQDLMARENAGQLANLCSFSCAQLLKTANITCEIPSLISPTSFYCHSEFSTNKKIYRENGCPMCTAKAVLLFLAKVADGVNL